MRKFGVLSADPKEVEPLSRLAHFEVTGMIRMFTMNHIESTAESILSKDSDAVVRFRLLRDVLMVPASSVEYRQARKATLQSHWVKELEEEQWENGSWGRFHSENTKIKSRYPTTEFAIRRGLELGLDKKDKVFVKAIRYMTDVLEDRVRWSDGYEKSPCFPIAVKLFTAAELSQIDPSHRFGGCNPGGRLTLSVPKHVGHLPVHYFA